MSEQQIDPKKLERAIRKIKHCLALSASSNEHEAAAAMRQAQALMREYRLTETQVRISDVGEAESQQIRTTRRPYWDRQLSAVVADVFGVESIRRWRWNVQKARREERAVFIGVLPAQHVALYAYETLLTKVKLARKAYVADVRAGRARSTYGPDTAGDHFAEAWVSQVYSKLQALIPQGEEDLALEQHSDGRGLVAVEQQDKALIAEYLAGLQLGKARKRPEVQLDLDAMVAGYLAGKAVELHAGIATGGDEVLQLT